jgi:hypothetical protein
MKLYTEEQVKDLEYWKNNAEENYVTTPISVLRYISELEKLTPIELPSDDEICDEAESIAHNYFVMQRNHYQGLEEGAKRMAYWLMKNFKKDEKE